MRQLIFLLVATLVFAGCTSGNSDDSNAPSSGGNSFVQGEEAINLEFFAQSPPRIVYPGSSFGITLNIENVGSHSITPRRLQIFENNNKLRDEKMGNDVPQLAFFAQVRGLPGIFTVDNDLNPPLVEERDDTLAGTEKDIDGNSFDGDTIQLDFDNAIIAYDDNEKLHNEFVFPVKASVCAPYQTRAVSSYCVLQDFLQNADEALCSISGGRTVENSGAPLHVSSITQRITGPDSLSFIVTFEKVGKGQISLHRPPENRFRIENQWVREDACVFSRERKNFFLARIVFDLENERLNDALNCRFAHTVKTSSGTLKNEGYLRLSGDKAQLLCSLDFSKKTSPPKLDVIRQLTILAHYDYLIEEETNITVRPLLR